jgi:hypothetical protein
VTLALKIGAVVVLVVAAFYAGVQYQESRNDYDYYRTTAVLASSETALCTGALTSITIGRIGLAKSLLETRLKTDVTTALGASRKMAKLQVPIPSIVEGMHRTAEYAQAHGMARVAVDATQTARNLAAAGGVWADTQALTPDKKADPHGSAK